MSLRTFVKPMANVLRRAMTRSLGEAPTWRRVPWIGRRFWMRIDAKQTMDLGYYFGAYEPALVRVIDLLVRPGEKVIDIGTHKGYVTLLLAKAVGPLGHVIAIDPDPRVFGELTANCRRNGYDHVSRYPYAVGDSRGLCEFYLSNTLGNSSRFPNEIAKPEVASVIKVETRTVDEILSEARLEGSKKPFTLVKIDAEGSELHALRGMDRLLRSDSPALYMELNVGSLRSGGMSVQDILDFLDERGYAVFRSSWHRSNWLRCVVSLERLGQVDGGRDQCFEILAIRPTHVGWNRIRPLLRDNGRT